MKAQLLLAGMVLGMAGLVVCFGQQQAQLQRK